MPNNNKCVISSSDISCWLIEVVLRNLTTAVECVHVWRLHHVSKIDDWNHKNLNWSRAGFSRFRLSHQFLATSHWMVRFKTLLGWWSWLAVGYVALQMTIAVTNVRSFNQTAQSFQSKQIIALGIKSMHDKQKINV